MGNKQAVGLRWGWRRGVIWGKVTNLILDLVSAMGLWDIPEKVASCICRAGLRRKVGGGGWW